MVFSSASRGLLILHLTLGTLTSEAALNGPVRPDNLSRRALLVGALATPLLVAGPQKGSSEGPPRDPQTAWTFFGLVAPPIQATWSYDTLVDQARAENLAAIQTAVSHDCVIATTHDGTRFASLIADSAVPTLLLEVEKPDGSLPFLVLPMDENRAAVRDVATQFLNLLGVLWLAGQADLLPWDTPSYSSIAEREAAKRGGEKMKNKLLAQLCSALKKNRTPARRWPLVTRLAHSSSPSALYGSASHTRPGCSGGCSSSIHAYGFFVYLLGVEHDEALRRVLGLVRWDAAAELKEKIELAGLEVVQQLRKVRRASDSVCMHTDAHTR